MTRDQRIDKIAELGKFLGQFRTDGVQRQSNVLNNDPHFENLKDRIQNAIHTNGWFTPENILYSMEQWSHALEMENLKRWTAPYAFGSSRVIGIVLAGNIPLVGFHDLISVLISGHKALVKLSSNDSLLIPAIVDYLKDMAPEFRDKIIIAEKNEEGIKAMAGYDGIIATGSNNTARYFEYYFSSKPRIIRKNRNSVAVLTGEETSDQLADLGEDIFRYYGLGCRNVSKLYVPESYNFDQFFKAVYPWNMLINQSKYANNYDYNKAVYLMSQFKLLENGFLMLKEDQSMSSPIATLFYEKYQDVDQVKLEIERRKEEIQCVVSSGLFESEVPFGSTQKPQLWDYADDVDTLKFLSEEIYQNEQNS